MNIIEITKENFNDEVLNCTKPVLVDFWASWCGPCQMIAPTIQEIADEMENVKVCKINVDQEQELARQFAVMSIPTLCVFNGGNIVNKNVGVMSKNDIIAMLS